MSLFGPPVTVSGEMRREVVCEKCGHAYLYYVKDQRTREPLDYGERLGAGLGLMGVLLGWVLEAFSKRTPQERAEADAKKTVSWHLRRKRDLAPCPKCGWYQRDMVREARRRRLRRMLSTGLALTSIGLMALVVMWVASQPVTGGGRPAAIPSYVFLAGWGVVTLGLGIMVARLLLLQRYDINVTPPPRGRAITPPGAPGLARGHATPGAATRPSARVVPAKGAAAPRL